MKTLRTLIAASLSAAFLAACGGQPVAPLATHSSSDRASYWSILGNGQALYVVNEPESGMMGTVTVYSSAGLVRTVTDGLGGPISVAVDGSGQLYVSNFTINTVTVYDGRGKSLVRTITRNLLRPSRLAFDSKGNLYVIRQNEVNIYVNGKSRIMHSIKIQAANAIALDSQDNLYISTGSGNTVNVYAPGSKTPTRTITQGIDDAGSLALDSAGNLYVGNAHSKSFYGDITVYAPGSKSVMRTITQGVYEPTALAFDSSANLYVANAGHNGPLGNYRNRLRIWDWFASSDALQTYCISPIIGSFA